MGSSPMDNRDSLVLAVECYHKAMSYMLPFVELLPEPDQKRVAELMIQAAKLFIQGTGMPMEARELVDAVIKDVATD